MNFTLIFRFCLNRRKEVQKVRILFFRYEDNFFLSLEIPSFFASELSKKEREGGSKNVMVHNFRGEIKSRLHLIPNLPSKSSPFFPHVSG